MIKDPDIRKNLYPTTEQLWDKNPKAKELLMNIHDFRSDKLIEK